MFDFNYDLYLEGNHKAVTEDSTVIPNLVLVELNTDHFTNSFVGAVEGSNINRLWTLEGTATKDGLLNLKLVPDAIDLKISIPRPETVFPEVGTRYYMPLVHNTFEDCIADFWSGSQRDVERFKSGLVHLTDKAAYLHSRVLLTAYPNRGEADKEKPV